VELVVEDAAADDDGAGDVEESGTPRKATGRARAAGC
jgi:hypothetical protein